MHRLLFSCSMLLALTANSYAQNIRVVDADGNALPGIAVSNGTKAITDAAGKASLPVSAYPVKIELTGIGFETAKRKIGSSGWTTITLDRKAGSLDETIVTGIARPMALQSALSRYTIIDRASIDRIGAVTLADALTTQLNLNIGNDAVLGSSLTMQGLSSDKVKILIDGMPVNGRENGGIDMGQLNLNNVARIEIVKGPMSTVYGSDAIGGIVNLISRQRQHALDADATINYETIGKYNINASLGRKWNHHQLSISGGRNYFNGWGDIDKMPVKRVLLFKPKEQYLANAAYAYTSNKGLKIQLASDYLWEKVTNKGSLTGYPYNAIATDQLFYTRRSLNRLSLESKVGKTGYLRLQNSLAYYRRVREDVIKNLVDLSETKSTAGGAQDTSVFKDVNLRSNYSNHWKKLSYDGGYDVLLQYATSQKFGENIHHTQHDYAAYGNASRSFLKDRLTIQAGLRGSYNSAYNTPVTTSINALYNPSGKFQFRASYAHSFRAPTLKEMYLEFIDLNHHIIGNPDLKAEEGNNYQASCSWQYRTKEVAGHIVVTGYYNDITNMITLVAADTIQNTSNYTYANIAHIRNAIANIQADINWKNLYISGGFGLTHTFAEQNAFSAFDAAEATINAHYLFPKPKLGISVFAKHTGKTKVASAIATDNDLFGGTVSAYQLVNISADRKFLNDRLQIVLGIKNLFNSQTSAISGAAVTSVHGDQGSIGILPRSFFTTLRFTL